MCKLNVVKFQAHGFSRFFTVRLSKGHKVPPPIQNRVKRDNPNHKTEIKIIDMLKYSRNTLKDKLTKHILSTHID